MAPRMGTRQTSRMKAPPPRRSALDRILGRVGGIALLVDASVTNLRLRNNIIRTVDATALQVPASSERGFSSF